MIMSKFKDLFLIVEGGHFSDREIKKENKKKVRGKDMTKFFVKKPYFVLVTVIIVLVIGFVSLGEMQSICAFLYVMRLILEIFLSEWKMYEEKWLYLESGQT